MSTKLQIETLRTLQRDEEIISDINQTFIDILTKLRINKLNFHQNANLSIISRLCYYTLTSLSNLQTIGEEYTGLLRVDSSRKALISKPVHFLWLICETYGESISYSIVTNLEHSVRNNNELLPDAKAAILSSLRLFRNSIPFIIKLQKVQFYLLNQPPNIPRRLFGVNYRSVVPKFEQSPTVLFKSLGILTLLNVLISISSKVLVWKNQYGVDPVEVTSNGSTAKCVLCLETRKNDCVTQCGHVFCWKCIGDWCNVRNECPICRESINSSRNILLQNYV